MNDNDRTDPANDPRAREIAEVSPEGLPAHPETGAKSVTRLAIILAIGAIALGVIVGLVLGSPGMGVTVGLVALLLTVVMNPVLWASRVRVKEREELDNAEKNS